MIEKICGAGLRIVTLLFLLTPLLTTSAWPADNKGTREFSFDILAVKNVDSADRGLVESNVDFPLGLRIGFFFTERLEMDTRISINFLSGEERISGSLGLSHNFDSPHREVVPFVGLMGTIDRRESEFVNPEQFGLGLTMGIKTMGVKTIDASMSPRLELSAVRRFANADFPADFVIAASVGISFFFKSSNPWDK